MIEMERFERFAAQAREARELAAFARATRTLNEADDVLQPGTAEAERVVAALEAMFLVASGQDEDEAPSFRRIVGAVMGELDSERADELVESLAGNLEDEGLDIRLKWVGEALQGSRPFAEQTFKLCVAVASLFAEADDPSDQDELLTGLSEELGLTDDRADELRALVDAAMRPDGA
ncbi:MAG TPA: hypothetical protein VGK67_03045 [Myxococcales bacterium]|jgi:hypothetical protein